MKKILIFIFCISFVLASDEIYIPLSSSKVVYPLYLSLVSKNNSDISDLHLNKLRDIFKFDMSNSGYIKLLKEEKGKNSLLASNDFSKAFDNEFWKDQKVRFIIKLTATEKKLNVFLYDVTQSGYNYISTIDLSGDLNIDRRKIHGLTDGIISEYLGKKSVTKSTLIYTVRKESFDRDKPWTSEVWSCDYDGENRKQLTFENDYCVSPVYLSNKNSIFSFLYVSYKKGIPKIYIDTETKKGELIPLRGNQLLPTISSNLDMVAFISDAAGRPDLFLQKLDKDKNLLGKPIQLFSAPKASQATSSFSPDGKKIAFVSDKDGAPRIYIIKIPEDVKKHLRPYANLITKKNRYNVTPSWSNDGEKLVYSSKINGVRQIYIYDFGLDEERQITFGKENKENPCWAEDNLHIVYNTEDKNISELYIINLNDIIPVKISSGVGQKRFPTWCGK